jgi:hypothetical protein
MGRRALQFDDWLAEAHIGNGLSKPQRGRLQKEFFWPALVIPRLLGLSVFFFVGWAMCTARRNLLPARGMPEANEAVVTINWLLLVLIVLAVAYVVLIWKRRAMRASLTGTKQADWPLLTGDIPFLMLILRPRTHFAVTRAMARSWLSSLLVLASVLATVVFAAAIVNPHFVADWLPRALFLPVMLGGGVLLLGEVAALSHRWTTPLLLILALIGGFLGWYFDHFNDVRWLKAAAPSKATAEAQQLYLPQAIERWRRDNCDSNGCPRPIVIAGAGGASRAGFYTASVVGALIDLGRAQPGIYGDIRSRIFAMSTVSGSSAGAVMMRAALADAAETGDPGKPPCRQEAGDGAWVGSKRAAGARQALFDAGASWRDCFEQLMAGDFLSPVFVGLAYRDNFPLGNPLSRRAWWGDRAVLLEQAFERRYHDITGKGAGPCRETDTAGLCRRVGHHPDIPRGWLPLLFLNGTSVSTGRRIIASDVRIGCMDKSGQPFLEFAYDYVELRDPSVRGATGCPLAASAAADNILLSTGATMSARFPVISPHGVIRENASNTIIDGIVDGGYFENDGLATLADIVTALKTTNLDPIAIRIVNEPENAPSPHQLGAKRPDLPKTGERALFDVYTSALSALYATRSGHEDGHAAYLYQTIGNSASVIEIGVYPPKASSENVPRALCRRKVDGDIKMEVVSMSWWMSQPVQAYLDAQLCDARNWKPLVCRLKKTDQTVEGC